MKHYYAIRPVSMPEHIRIEKAETPAEATVLAFGRGRGAGWQYKDLGTRVAVLHSDKQRIALLKDKAGWTNLPPTKG